MLQGLAFCFLSHLQEQQKIRPHRMLQIHANCWRNQRFQGIASIIGLKKDGRNQLAHANTQLQDTFMSI